MLYYIDGGRRHYGVRSLPPNLHTYPPPSLSLSLIILKVAMLALSRILIASAALLFTCSDAWSGKMFSRPSLRLQKAASVSTLLLGLALNINSAPFLSSSPLLPFPSLVPAAHAKEGQQGTRSSKTFEVCMSKCIYQQTRPPPIGSSSERLEQSKSRGEIVTDCKMSCATTKEQTMVGKPKVRAEK